MNLKLGRERISKGEGIIGASLIELGEVEDAREVLFASGDAEALNASAFRASHKPPLVNGRIAQQYAGS